MERFFGEKQFYQLDQMIGKEAMGRCIKMVFSGNICP
jgi:hypothetical protein